MFERHVEKAVLAATAAGLILVMAFWVISSPRIVRLKSPGGHGAGDYPPAEVDRALRSMAEDLKAQLEGQVPPNDPVLDYPSQIREKFGNPYPVGRMPGMPVALGPGGPKLIPTEVREMAKAELATLQPLAAPDKCLVAANRELVTIPRTTADGTKYDEKELVAAHVAFVVNHGQILKKWREALKDTGIRARFVVLAVEAQRRQLLPDGRWGEPVPVSMVRVPAEAPFGPLPAFDEKKKNYDEVLAAVDAIADIRSQTWVLEPDYYDVWRNGQPKDWMDDKPRTEVSDLEGVEPARAGVTSVRRPLGVEQPSVRTVRPVEPDRTSDGLYGVRWGLPLAASPGRARPGSPSRRRGASPGRR